MKWGSAAASLAAVLVLASSPGATGRDDTEKAQVRSQAVPSGSFMVNGTAAPSASVDPYLAADLAQLAKQEGESFDAVEARYRGIEAFTQMVSELEKAHADTFVRAGVAPAGSKADYWVQFTTDPSESIRRMIKSLSSDVVIEYGATANAVEIADSLMAIAKSLGSRADVIQGSKVFYDHTRQEIVVAYDAVNAASESAVAAAVDDAERAGAAASQDGLLPVPVSPEPDDSLTAPTPETTVQGGRELRLVSNNNLECTGGFTAVRNGNRGILTAEHCGDAVRYNSELNVISTSPALASYSAIDLQFHRTLTGNGHDTNNQFRATGTAGTDDRTVSGVANGVVDSPVCHWGIESHYQCSEIARVDICITVVGGATRCGIDETKQDVSGGGDSGGPWFLGSSARGIHSAGLAGQNSYFTRSSRIYQHLSATILQ